MKILTIKKYLKFSKNMYNNNLEIIKNKLLN
jgi:hypothetical protein